MIPKYNGEASLGTPLAEPRTCRCCGKIHSFIPYNAIDSGEGRFWFNCECNSTLVVKLDQVKSPENLSEADQKIHRIVYVSRVNMELSYESLNQLREEIEEKNSLNQITGFLQFNRKYFIGCIEGERSNLGVLFNKLSLDRRHFDVEIVSFERIRQRRFAGWGVALLESTPFMLNIRSSGKMDQFNPYSLSNSEIYQILEEGYDYFKSLQKNVRKSAS